MKKKTGIGIGVAMVVFVIIFGITSLPDNVLEPPLVDTSEVQPGEEKITVPSESISTKEQSKPEEEIPVEQSKPEEETQENVIEVKIRDGVGAGEK